MSQYIKHFFKILLFPIVVRIKDGPLKGGKWILSSGINFILGKYEPEKTRAVSERVKKNYVIYDIGAHVGYFTVLMSKLSGSKGKVFAFEPRPINLLFLKKHLRINNCGNVVLTESCVGATQGDCQFNTRTGTGTGHVSIDGNLKTTMIVLDELYESNDISAPDFIKIDVEGGEFEVLNGAKYIIEKHRPTILLATHSEGLHRQCLLFLEKYDYKFIAIDQEKGDVETIAIQ